MTIATFITDTIKKIETLGIRTPENVDLNAAAEGILGMPEEILEAMEPGQIIGMLFAAIGHGIYDYTDWSWQPSSDQVYSFDVEAFDCSNMYTAFLQGISAITRGDLEFTDVTEDCSKVDYEKGCGIQTIRFQCNGQAYQYDAAVNYDWFDTGMLYFINRMIKEMHTGKSLYAVSDGYQCCILFYQTEEWSERFQQLFGMAPDDLGKEI